MKGADRCIDQSSYEKENSTTITFVPDGDMAFGAQRLGATIGEHQLHGCSNGR